MNIEKATPADIVTLVTFSNPPGTPFVVAKDHSWFEKYYKDEQIWVFNNKDGHPTGYAIIEDKIPAQVASHVSPEYITSSCYLRLFYIFEPCRNQKNGRTGIFELVEKFGPLVATVHPDNIAARRCFAAHSHELTEILARRGDPNEPRVVLRLS